MGTRSTIALEFADGTVEQVYCHWDGYLANNGKILQAHYMDPFKVKQLVALGGFSSLCATVEATAETAYTQRGEDLVVNRYMDLEDYEDNCQQEEYDYILRPVGGVAVWYVRCYSTKGKWVTMAEGFKIQQLEEECEE
jgi:hypothetical protein